MSSPCEPPRPNIILILADDMGYSDIGCFGGEIHTPHLDHLAEGGVRFTQFYNAARCCPSRASLLTGLYPHQAGIGQMVTNLGHPSYQGFLNDRCVTIAEALRAGGYRTALAGKWHVGGRYSTDPATWQPADAGHPLPSQRGFQRFRGILGGAGSYYNPHSLMEDGEWVTLSPDEPYYHTDDLSNYAVRQIEALARGDAPFFLFVSYTAPHWPLHALPEDIARYRGRYAGGWNPIRTARHERLRDLGILDPAWAISPRDEHAPEWADIAYQDWEDARMATYAAQVDRMDQGIGHILAALAEAGIEEDTLVMFLSDNGGCAELLREDGDPGSALTTTLDGRPVKVGNTIARMPGPADTFMSYDLPWANVSNTPFRLYKHWVHEGGIATPFIMRWPERVPAHGLTHEPAHLIDIIATCLDAAGVAYPGAGYDAQPSALLPLEGESLLPACRACGSGATWQRERPLCWEHEGNRAVRQGRWKLVSRHPGRWELYDMATDRTELHDIASRYPGLVRELGAIYDDWAARCGVLPWEEVRRRFSPATAARMASYLELTGGVASRRHTRP